RPVVYIDDTVITWGDIRDRVRQVITQMQAQGMEPRSAAELQELEREAREALIEEELLLLEAQRLQVRIPRERIRRFVLEEARRAGVGNDMRSVAEAIRRRERIEMIRHVLEFYRSVQPDIGPARLRESYQERQESFRRPGRTHLYQIAINASDQAAGNQLQNRLLALVRHVRGHDQEEIRDLVDADFVDQVVEAEGEAQRRLLLGLVQRLDGLEQLAQWDAALAAEVEQLHDLAAGLRTRAEAETLMQDLRSELMAVAAGQRVARFQALAREHSTGPAAEHGGDLGWLELGALTLAQRKAVADLDERQVSEPFWSGQALIMLMPAEIDPPQQRSFGEVSGELATMLERSQDEAMRANLIRKLRQQAHITMVGGAGEPVSDAE
ncbi:MAG: peptidylprolyl isomerase, partial [Planctomycetota bacterium]